MLSADCSAILPAKRGEIPMPLFPEREAAEEQRFVHEKETDFKISARRNALIGIWAGEMLGLKDRQCTAYANELLRLAARSPGDSRLLARLAADLAPIGISERKIRNELDRQSVIAKTLIAA